MKKLYLSVIFLAVFLFVVSAASAAIQIESVTSPSGNPGSTVTVSMSLRNTGTSPVTSLPPITSTDLIGIGGSIAAPSISSTLTSPIAAGATGTKTFTITLPTLQAGVYQGTLGVNVDEDTEPYSVTINSVTGLDVTDRDNDANKLVIIADQGDRVTGTFKVKNTGSVTLTDVILNFTQADFKDSDDDEITITRNPSLSTTSPLTLTPGQEVTVTLTLDVDNAIEMNTYDGTITVSSASAGKSDTFTLEVRVQPEVCSDGKVGNLRIDLKEPDSGDDFKPGEKISLDVKVENNDNNDLDVTVTAFLFDVDDGDNVEEVDSDTVNIDEDDDDTFEFDLIVPEDVNDGNQFKLFVKAYEDGNEDEHCDETSIELDIKRERNDVIIKSIRLAPATTKPGDSVAVEVTVQNIGSRDQDNVIISLKNPELGVDLDSNSFDIEKFDDDDTQIQRFTFTVPDDAQTGTYDLEAIVDFGASTVSNFAPLKVEAAARPPEAFASLEVSDLPTSVEAGKSFDLTVKVVNTGDATATYSVELGDLGSWANTVSSQTITLGTGKTGTLFFTLQTKADAKGAQSATVTVLSGNEVLDSQEISVNLGEATGEETGEGINFGKFFSGTTLWIIADIVLVIIAIVFIRMLFKSRKRE